MTVISRSQGFHPKITLFRDALGYAPAMPPKAGQMLKDRRLELGLTQFQAARRADLKDTDISRWERGHVASPPLLGVWKLCRVLRLDINEVAQALADEEEA